jgi:hypothetical protein
MTSIKNEEISKKKYQGVCRKCPCFEDSVHTDSGMWCYWWKDDERKDCPARLALESLEQENDRLKKKISDANKLIPYFEDMESSLDVELGGRVLDYDEHVSSLKKVLK